MARQRRLPKGLSLAKENLLPFSSIERTLGEELY
jgi:hypothetical protein